MIIKFNFKNYEICCNVAWKFEDDYMDEQDAIESMRV